MGSWVEQTTVTKFRNLDLRRLSVDQAYLNISSHFPSSLWLYTLSDECYRCPYSRVQEIKRRRENVLKIDTKFGLSWRIYDQDVGPYTLESAQNSQILCDLRPDVGEFGVYDVTISDAGKCSLNTALHPVNIYLRKCEFF
ncbi:hypothetical protein DMENIID0001_096520 [Sergentomyia squamirostris]